MYEILKGDRADITKYKQNLSDITVGMGWDAKSSDTNNLIIDLVAILADYNSHFVDMDRFIFYNNPILMGKRDEIIKFIPTEEVVNNKSMSDMEQIKLSLFDIPNSVSEIIFGAAIYDPTTTNHTLADLKKLHLHLYNSDTKEELVSIKLDKYFTIETCLVFGKLYRQDDYWKFENISEGYIGDLGSLFGMYYRGEKVDVLAKGESNG